MKIWAGTPAPHHVAGRAARTRMREKQRAGWHAAPCCCCAHQRPPQVPVVQRRRVVGPVPVDGDEHRPQVAPDRGDVAPQRRPHALVQRVLLQGRRQGRRQGQAHLSGPAPATRAPHSTQPSWPGHLLAPHNSPHPRHHRRRHRRSRSAAAAAPCCLAARAPLLTAAPTAPGLQTAAGGNRQGASGGARAVAAAAAPAPRAHPLGLWPRHAAAPAAAWPCRRPAGDAGGVAISSAKAS